MQTLLKSVFENLSLDEARREYETYHQERTKTEEKARQAAIPWGTAPLTAYSPDYLESAGIVEFASNGADCVAVVVAKGIYTQVFHHALKLVPFCVPVYATLPGSEEKLWHQPGNEWKTEAQITCGRCEAPSVWRVLGAGLPSHPMIYSILPCLAKEFTSIKATMPTRTDIHLTDLAQYAVAWFDELPSEALLSNAGEPRGEGSLSTSTAFVQCRFCMKTPALVTHT
jgi:hypothetical protein